MQSDFGLGPNLESILEYSIGEIMPFLEPWDENTPKKGSIMDPKFENTWPYYISKTSQTNRNSET